MAVHYLWWLVAVGLGIAELATGSFWLLVLAAGAAAAGFAALAGFSAITQIITAALVAAAGALLVRRRYRRASAPAPMNADVNLDIGATLRVERWSEDRRARVRYRGAQWDVELLPGFSPAPGVFEIREVVGSRLRVIPGGETSSVTSTSR